MPSIIISDTCNHSYFKKSIFLLHLKMHQLRATSFVINVISLPVISLFLSYQIQSSCKNCWVSQSTSDPTKSKLFIINTNKTESVVGLSLTRYETEECMELLRKNQESFAFLSQLASRTPLSPYSLQPIPFYTDEASWRPKTNFLLAKLIYFTHKIWWIAQGSNLRPAD